MPLQHCGSRTISAQHDIRYADPSADDLCRIYVGVHILTGGSRKNTNNNISHDRFDAHNIIFAERINVYGENWFVVYDFFRISAHAF